MVESWEAKEWAESDVEIKGVQDDRLVLLEQALQVGWRGCCSGLCCIKQSLGKASHEEQGGRGAVVCVQIQGGEAPCSYSQIAQHIKLLCPW